MSTKQTLVLLIVITCPCGTRCIGDVVDSINNLLYSSSSKLSILTIISVEYNGILLYSPGPGITFDVTLQFCLSEPEKLPYDVGENMTLCHTDTSQPAITPNVYLCQDDMECCLRDMKAVCCLTGEKEVEQQNELLVLQLWTYVCDVFS